MPYCPSLPSASSCRAFGLERFRRLTCAGRCADSRTPLWHLACFGAGYGSARASAGIPSSWSRLVRGQEQTRRALRLVRRKVAETPEIDPVTSAKIAELRHVDDLTMPGICRAGRRAHPYYIDPH